MRLIKAGDRILVVLIGDKILLVNAIEGTEESSESKPWFTDVGEKFLKGSVLRDGA